MYIIPILIFALMGFGAWCVVSKVGEKENICKYSHEDKNK